METSIQARENDKVQNFWGLLHPKNSLSQGDFIFQVIKKNVSHFFLV